MQKGDIIATYNTNPFNIICVLVAFFSNPIAFFLKGFWNIPVHVLIYAGGNDFIESVFNNGVHVTKKITAKKFKVFKLVGVTAAQREKILTYIKSKVGKGYDYKAILGIMLFPLLRLFRLKNPLNDMENYFCSELLPEAIMRKTKIKINKYAGFVSPYDLIEMNIFEVIDK